MATLNSITTAQLVSPAFSFIAAGYFFASSHNNVNNLFTLPAKDSISIFTRIYHRGATFVAPSVILASLSAAYLSYALPAHRTQWALAGTLTLATQPWTIVIMLPGIKRLLFVGESQVETEKVQGTGEHVKLMKAWVWQNFVRSTLAFAGGMVGLTAIVL